MWRVCQYIRALMSVTIVVQSKIEMFSTVCLCIILVFRNVSTFTVGVSPTYNQEMFTHNSPTYNQEMFTHSIETTPLPNHSNETTPRWTCFGQVLCGQHPKCSFNLIFHLNIFNMLVLKNLKYKLTRQN